MKVLANWADPREAEDQDLLCRSIELVLGDYPIDVQETIADPRSQVLGRIRAEARRQGEYLPFVEAVRRACEDVHGPARRMQERRRAIQRQLEEREKSEWGERETTPELRRRVAESLQEFKGMISPSPEREPDPMMAERSKRAIERAYREAGQEPVMCGGTIISPSLVQQIRERNDAPE